MKMSVRMKMKMRLTPKWKLRFRRTHADRAFFYLSTETFKQMLLLLKQIKL